jgi:hypothetical protein
MTITLEPEKVKEAEVEVAEEVKTLQSEERQTIVHCLVDIEFAEAFRIWSSTYLIEHGSDRRAKLLTAYNISFAPTWTINDGKGFTLIFEGLSKDCKMFDLKEIIPQDGGFESLNIERNKTDVYYVNF